MIAGIFHQGSGLGNQLFRYVMTRTLAADRGIDFGMVNPELFKGASFMNLDMGKPVSGIQHEFHERKVMENGVDVRGYDPEINFIADNAIVDGEFQDERYFSHRLKEIDQWLRVEPLATPDDECVIGFRGGEYTTVPDLFLPYDYWFFGIKTMVQTMPQMKFRVVTDDVPLAQRFFPELPVSHEVGHDWRSIRHAKWVIMANSSFYILPALLNEGVKLTIAPRFWARRNTGVWALPQNYYRKFFYI